MVQAMALLLMLMFQVPQVDVAGEWAATLTLPYGDTAFAMMLVQKGRTLSGYILNETGQFDLKGAVDRDEIKVEWSYPDAGKVRMLTFTGKVAGDSISGSAKIGDVAQGTMSARRK